MRVALVHDWLTGMRGGERVLHELVRLYPGAELHTLVHVAGSTSPRIEALPIHASPLSGVPGVARHYRKLLPLFPWAIERFHFDDYDLVISCSHAVAKGVRVPPGTPHLCYCLTPMRYVWHQADSYLGRGPRRWLAAPFISQLRRFDLRSSTPERVQRFVAISSEVSRRIRDCYGRESGVVFPPVDVDRFARLETPRDDFYLLVGGFVPYKREALAVAAFSQLRRRLVVVGDGPMRRRVAAAAPEWVEFRGRVSDEELADLYARARALVYPQLEDFGIVAVEAQAAGCPVIAFGQGGARDTVLPLESEGPDSEATGIFFEDAAADSLAEAVVRFEAEEARFHPKAIRRWAERFGIDRFRREFEREVEETLAGH